MSANVGANASDVGLIVQGTLIFLSAVVGVVVGAVVVAVLHVVPRRGGKAAAH